MNELSCTTHRCRGTCVVQISSFMQRAVQAIAKNVYKDCVPTLEMFWFKRWDTDFAFA